MIAGLGAAGILAAGSGTLAAGTTVVLGAGVAAATPEEDCAENLMPAPATDLGGGDAGKMLLLLTGIAGGLAGASRFGRESLAGGRWPWSVPVQPRPWESVLSQAVGTAARPLMRYAPGGQSKLTVDEPGGGQRTFFLIHDESSLHESQIPVDVPPGRDHDRQRRRHRHGVRRRR